MTVGDIGEGVSKNNEIVVTFRVVATRGTYYAQHITVSLPGFKKTSTTSLWMDTAKPLFTII